MDKNWDVFQMPPPPTPNTSRGGPISYRERFWGEQRFWSLKAVRMAKAATAAASGPGRDAPIGRSCPRKGFTPGQRRVGGAEHVNVTMLRSSPAGVEHKLGRVVVNLPLLSCDR